MYRYFYTVIPFLHERVALTSLLLRLCSDKAGALSTVYDIIVSPTVVKEAGTDKTGKYKDFVCQLSIQSIEGKVKSSLDYRYKLPKGAMYIGEMQSQMIQDRYVSFLSLSAISSRHTLHNSAASHLLSTNWYPGRNFQRSKRFLASRSPSLPQQSR
jgi:PIH1 N-terminal domain